MLLFNPGIIKIQRKLIFFFFIIAITAFASKAQAKTPEVNFEGFYSVAGPLLGVLGVDHDEAKKMYNLGLGIGCTLINHIEKHETDFSPSAITFLVASIAITNGWQAYDLFIDLMTSSAEVNYLANTSGTSAGDALMDRSYDHQTKYLSWANVAASDARQKKINGLEAFRGHSSSMNIGADVNFTDNFLAGASLSILKDETKLTDSATNKKIKSQSLGIALYSKYNINEKMFLLTNVTYSDNRALVTSRKFNCRTGESSAVFFNPNSRSMTTGALLGYNNNIKDNLIITPYLGLEVHKVFANRYDEKSKDSSIYFKLVSVKSKQSANVNSVIGVNTKALLATSKAYIIPEAHVNITKSLKRPKKIVDINYVAFDIAHHVTSSSNNRVVTNLGVGTTFLSNSRTYELKLKYDHFMAKKFYSNIVAAEVRVNF